MPGVFVHHHHRVRDTPGKPFPVGRWYEHIAGAVTDLDRHPDLSGIESPRLDEGKIVIDPTPDASSQRLSKRDTPSLVGALIGEDRPVGFRQVDRCEQGARIIVQPVENILGLPSKLASERVFTSQRPAEFLDVDRVHSRDPVEARGIVRRG